MIWKSATTALAACCVVALPAVAASRSFAITDLTRIKITTLKLHGKDFVARAEPKRLTFACLTCKGFEAVDVLLDKSTDGTEQRFRKGETTVAKIQENCRRAEPNCAITRVDLNGAVGWVSRTKAAGSFVSTTVMFKGGDRLVIRSIAETPQSAFDNGVTVRSKLAPQIIG